MPLSERRRRLEYEKVFETDLSCSGCLSFLLPGASLAANEELQVQTWSLDERQAPKNVIATFQEAAKNEYIQGVVTAIATAYGASPVR
jgi:hypothetical protein